MGILPPTFQFNEYFTPYLKYQIAENAKTCKKTQYLLRAIPEKNTWGGGGGGKKANDIFFYGWLVLTFFKLYGSLVFETI